MNKYIFLSCLSIILIYLIDMSTTVIGLSMGFEEQTPLIRYFISNFGLITGVIFAIFFVCGSIFYLLKFLSYLADKFIKKRYKNKLIIGIYLTYATIFVFLELSVIISNISGILRN